MDQTLRRIREARAALVRLQVELAKVEYLATARLPHVEHLQEPLRKHTEEIAAGLVALAKQNFQAAGVYGPYQH